LRLFQGIIRGNAILTNNAWKITTMGSMRKAKNSVKAGEEVEFVIRRSGKEMTFKIASGSLGITPGPQ